ncbi:MAG: 4-hydroxy-tetrahydrodipicolinate reductase [Candidatus Eisenbacteria bacterium]|nr:4-hydroxy-tetrahydrodipicolinate reductase [Candidatus Eisenbacteria bacterium]
MRVVLSGICGRMGTLVARSIAEDEGLLLAGGVEMPGHEQIGRPICDVWEESGSRLPVAADLGDYAPDDYDVIVDFSTPAQAVSCAEIASRFKKGLVIGTTGLTQLQMALIQEAAASCPVVVAPNTSVAMNLLFGLVRRAAAVLGPAYDVEIVETHHRHKKDAPSGTAKKLLRLVSSERKVDPARAARYGRKGMSEGREADEIGIHSLRSGAVVGRHHVSFMSDVEELKLSHEALSREAFARGALRAVRFVEGRAAGLYDMLDVLGLSGVPE